MRSTDVQQLPSRRILITGIIRNGEKTLSQEVRSLQNAFRIFKDVSFFFVESDSSDKTLNVLADLANRLPKFEYMSLGKLQDAIPERIERIVYCRNTYLDFVYRNSTDFDYIVVADLDGVNTLLSPTKVLTCWDRTDWDVCTANQTGPYYDVYALRVKGWVESDCWYEARTLYSNGMNPLKAWTKSIREKQILIPECSEWIEADSAFGGLAIYSINAFLAGRYQYVKNLGTVVSEHVPFHQAIRSAGFRIYINPSLTNFRFNVHNDFSRPSKRFKFALKYLVSLISPTWFTNHLMPDLKPLEKL
jgi:hypothetical protein